MAKASSIDELKAKTREAIALRDRLKAREAVARQSPNTFAQYKALLSKFDTVSYWAQKVTGVTESVRDALLTLANKAGRLVATDKDAKAQGVGVVPVAVWAVGAGTAAAALAAITAWVADAYKLAATLDAQARYMEAGATPDQAERLAKGAGQASGGSIGEGVERAAGGIGKLVIVGTVAGVMWAFRDDLAEMVRGKRRKG